MTRNVAMIGPFPPPLFGMSLSNAVLHRLGARAGWRVTRIDTNRKSIDKPGSRSGVVDLIATTVSVWGTVPFVRLRVRAFYITPAQSIEGLIRWLPVYLYLRITGARQIYHLHGNYIVEEFKKHGVIVRFFIRRVLELADVVITLTPALRNEIIRVIGADENRFVSINNFVESDFRIDDVELRLKATNFVSRSVLRLVFLSNIIKEKGIFEIIEAVAGDERFYLSIAGDVPDSIAKNFHEKIVYSNIEYLGVVTGPVKRDLLLNSDIFALPTTYPVEGQPISLLEAMSMGCFPVVTKHKGIPDSVPEVVAEYFVDRNAISIKDVLNRLYTNRGVLTEFLFSVPDVHQQYSEESFFQRIDRCVFFHKGARNGRRQ